ncbi:MAG: hypothetical protein KF832_08390 [Caldilineaceae bacterium]|nr:hypothetical protein [Caldilineaceae bacterium]
MKQYYIHFLTMIGIVSLLLMPNRALAADAATGIAFRIAYNEGRYEVYMRPSANAAGPALTLTAQVTIKVPHATDSNRFEVAELTSAVAGTEWTSSSRVDAPHEDAKADYLSFTVTFPESNHQAFSWQANQELLVFSFANSGTCQGIVSLLSNDDPFTSNVANGVINSAQTNPGNQIDVINLGDGNLYLGNYGETADCGQRNTEAQRFLYLPIITNE